MPIPRTMIDVAAIEDESDLDDFGGALRFASGTTSPNRGAITGPRIDGYSLALRVATTARADIFTGYHVDRMSSVVVALLRDGADTELARASARDLAVLARLRHPNVVTVLDAGTHWGRAFGVFEPLCGAGLGAWLQDHRSATAVVAAYRDIARGLAACHDAGVQSLEFSPSSVLVGRDGRARVLLPTLGASTDVSAADGFGRALSQALSRADGGARVQADLARAHTTSPTMVEWQRVLTAATRSARA